MSYSEHKKPLVLYLMRFESLKKGSFERFLIAFSKKVRTDYELVFVFESDPPGWLREELTELNVRVDSVQLGTNWRGFRDLDRLIKIYNPQIVHLHFFSLLTPFIPYLRWRHRKKIIVHIHAINPYDAGRTKFTTGLIPLRKRLVARSVCKAIAVSKFVRKKTAAEFPFHDDQLVTVYNGLEIPVSGNKETSDLRLTLGIPNGNIIILSAAWLTELKGIDVLIKSLPLILKHTDRDISVIIVGDGPERLSLESLAESLDVKQKVYFMGWRDDVPSILTQADIIAVPSVCEEACSYFVLESMAAVKPIVASEIGGIPELLSGNPPAGLLFTAGDVGALADSVVKLIENPKMRHNISSEARKRCLRRFHISRQVKLISQIYSSSLT